MNLLLLRLRLIGDVVFTTPLLRALGRRFPGAKLTYVVEPAAAPVLRGNPHIAELVVIPNSKGIARLRDDMRTAMTLRRRKFDVAIDLHGGPRAGWLTWASGARQRIGYAVPGRSWMYTDVIPRPDDLAARHSVQNQWDLLAPLGIAPGDPVLDPVEMAEDAAARSRVTRRLAEVGVSPESPLIVIHVSAGNPFRRWAADSFASLIVRVAERDPARRILLTSGPSDVAAARNIADEARRQLGPLRQTLPDTGDFDLPELHSLITRAAVYIGGDSGPMHIAATTRTPIVALLGPTLPERSMPWRDGRWFAEAVEVGPLPCRPCRQRTCAPGDFRCLTGIDAARVAAAVERAMASRAGTGSEMPPAGNRAARPGVQPKEAHA